MKTFTQWLEQVAQKDNMADEIAVATQTAIKSGKDPKKDVQKLLAKKSAEAQATGNVQKAAKVAGAAHEVDPEMDTKTKMMGKK